MSVLEKLGLGIILIFFFASTFLLGSYWSIFQGRSLGFLSFQPELKWSIDKDAVTKLDEIKRAAGAKGLVIVFLSGNFEYIPRSATGIGDGKPVYYARWGKFGPISILNVFVDIAEWEKNPEEKTASLVSNFVIRQIDNQYEFSDTLSKEALGLIYRDEGKTAIVKLVKR